MSSANPDRTVRISSQSPVLNEHGDFETGTYIERLSLYNNVDV